MYYESIHIHNNNACWNRKRKILEGEGAWPLPVYSIQYNEQHTIAIYNMHVVYAALHIYIQYNTHSNSIHIIIRYFYISRKRSRRTLYVVTRKSVQFIMYRLWSIARLYRIIWIWYSTDYLFFISLYMSNVVVHPIATNRQSSVSGAYFSFTSWIENENESVQVCRNIYIYISYTCSIYTTGRFHFRCVTIFQLFLESTFRRKCKASISITFTFISSIALA